MVFLRFVLLSILFSLCFCAYADNNSGYPNDKITETKSDMSALDKWEAGTIVSEKSIEKYGIDRCFVIEKISDAIFGRMYNKSYKTNCSVSRGDLRYIKILHRNINGDILLGEIVCNKHIAKDLIVIFRELYNASYPIERMILIDNYDADDERSMSANNSSCFNFRFVAGTKSLSKHSRGMAIDINPLYNPYVKRTQSGSIDISPRTGSPYANRNKSFNYKIDKNDLCYKLFIVHGFKWGGDWSTVKDYQHFEK